MPTLSSLVVSPDSLISNGTVVVQVHSKPATRIRATPASSSKLSLVAIFYCL